LPLKTLVLYIYWSRGTMQYKQQSYPIYSSYTHYKKIKCIPRNKKKQYDENEDKEKAKFYYVSIFCS
jgi:hypothetical protein